MSPDMRLRAKTLDPVTIGERVKQARSRSGLTQSQAADGIASTAYISRIESGTRRPHPDIIDRLAVRLGVDLEDLLPDGTESDAGTRALERVAELRLRLDYAELALRTGDADAAVKGAASVLTEAEDLPVIRAAALFVKAQALEACGEVNSAILVLEDLEPNRHLDPASWIRARIALSRCYREAGDLAEACAVGPQSVARIEEAGMSVSVEAVQLAVTVALAEFVRGEINQAVRMCERALTTADELGSPEARASVLWNSSVFEMQRGNAEDALAHAENALTLLQTTEDARNIARLRGEIGFMQLRLDPPRPVEALEGFRTTVAQLQWTSTGPADQARFWMGMAHAHLILDDVDDARTLCEDVVEATAGQAPVLHAEAIVLQGRIASRVGDIDGVRTAFESAVLISASLGTDRATAQIWFELATLLQTHGYSAEALDAYGRGAAASGLVRAASVERVIAAPAR